MKLHRAVAAIVLLFAAGCAPRYAVRTTAPEIHLQWPFQPQSAKVTYVSTLSGFSESTSLLKSIVYGGGGKEANSFILPVAVSIGNDGRMAVADMGRRCVHLYFPVRKHYLRLHGGPNESIASPVSVVFDDRLQMYVSDSAGKILVFGADGGFRFSISQAGGERLKRPTGLAFSNPKQLLFAVDTLANKVYAFHPDGELAFAFGERGEEKGQFNFPTHIFRSPAGALYVTDSLNFRIEMFDESGAFLGSFGHHGDGSGDLAMPKGVAVDRDGAVYVVDGIFDNVQLFSSEGVFLLTLGGRGVNFGEFWLPSGITIDDSGLLYVCDTYNRRVQVFRITEHYNASPS
ncbi:MAG TPA: hypothetical protein VLR94_07260 [Acidobacteriota bacterium]|nr:hypothetical protein [Acidobacteriota bacterium]